ncbi:MAG: hypothetical protein IKZ53_08420 [Selenomonadaceae bacterium]|nr:hypothetical protein [Selenomonadaceae bacterium]
MNFKVLIAAMFALIGCGLYFYEPSELPAEPLENKIDKNSQSRGVGIIDIEKIQAAHPDGEQLDYLRATEFRLRLELKEAMRITELPKPQPPESNTEVFDEAAWQKNAQVVISQLAKLETKKKAAAEEYRKKSEPHYIEERNKIREQFLNENLNIQLKLQNADNLHLTDAQVEELLKRLEEVEIERNNLQRELLDKWVAEIEQYAENSIAAEETRLKAEAERLRHEVETQARQKEAEVTERNKKIMEDSLRAMENRQYRRQELLAELQEVSKERAELEKKILNSIADKATMLAAVNRLEMLFVKHKSEAGDKVLKRGVDWNFKFKAPERVGAIIIAGKNCKDLTDDLIKEMAREQYKGTGNKKSNP